MSLAATLRCPCDKAQLRPAFAYDVPPAGETKFDLGGSPYARGYDVCSTCGHWFGRHDLDLSRLYESDYVDATYGGAEGMRARFEKIMALPPERSDNRARTARVAAFARTPGKLLDFGAGLGVFPAAMSELGWHAWALEPDARTRAHLLSLGLAGAVGTMAQCAPAAPFDAISFNKVLEHIEDPVATLSEARPLLAAGGFVYVEVPDVAAAQDGPGREEFFVEHHHVFSPASLALLCESAGFALARLERMREPSGKFTLVAFGGSHAA
jgi:SAM-dependent methyltransferase